MYALIYDEFDPAKREKKVISVHKTRAAAEKALKKRQRKLDKESGSAIPGSYGRATGFAKAIALRRTHLIPGLREKKYLKEIRCLMEINGGFRCYAGLSLNIY
jgi:hypothetical protein